jgi:quercetin dioxygenase-like cupin family protein
MKLKENEGKTIQFYATKMVFKNTLDQTNGNYSTILMTHPASIGPALHIHPNGPETFFILEGNYTFTLNNEMIEAGKGDFVFIPQNAPHKYKSGINGGQMLVTTPASVETYFLHIGTLKEIVSLDYEFEFAKNHGQIFLDTSEHWGRSL